MKSVKLISIAVVSLMVIVSSCKKSEGTNKGDRIQSVSVRIEKLKPGRLIDAIEVAGTAKASEDANISPEEGGVVKEWKVKKGEHVKRGDLIVVLKDEVAKAGCDAAESQYAMAELNLEKQKEVYDQQGISELQYKNLQYTRDAAKANAELMKARWERTQIRSPFDGVVDNTVPNEGEFAPPGVPIARVVNTSTIKIQAEVPEMYAGAIPVGTQATVAFDAISGETLKGRVTFTGSTLSPANRTLMVEIVLANIQGKIKPDMMAKVKLLREMKSDALLVSESLIQLVDRDRAIVYVEKDGKAEERRLKIGGRQGNMVEIIGGLRPGDRLIVAGYQKLVDGTAVTVVQ